MKVSRTAVSVLAPSPFVAGQRGGWRTRARTPNNASPSYAPRPTTWFRLPREPNGVGARSVGTRRQWLLDALGEVTIDLLGEIETVGTAPLQTLLGPYGEVRFMPVEELLVERVFMAFVCEPPDASALSAAKQLAAVCLAGGVRADWRRIERLAAGKEYGIAPAVRRLKLQVQRELRKKKLSCRPSGPGKSGCAPAHCGPRFPGGWHRTVRAAQSTQAKKNCARGCARAYPRPPGDGARLLAVSQALPALPFLTIG